MGISRGVAWYGTSPWVWDRSLGMSRLHAMCWSHPVRTSTNTKRGKKKFLTYSYPP